MKTAYVQFTCYLKEVARDMRNQFAAADCEHMHFSVTVEGRPDSDLKITFQIGRYAYDDRVKGNELEAVLLEFFRRNGWSRQHEPLCLPQVESNEEEGL